MAENKEPVGLPEFPEEEQEVDLLFKAEMAARNAVLGYWKHALVGLGAFLLVALVIGLWQQYVRSEVRAGSASIAQIDADQPVPTQYQMMGLVPLDDPNDAEHLKLLIDLAGRYEAAAAETMGASSSEALLKAADTWRRAGRTDDAARVYEQLANSGSGLFATAGRNGLAAIEVERGDVDRGLALLRRVADEEKGIFAERALLESMRLEVARGGDAAANTLREEFRLRFPTSPRLLEVQELGLTSAPDGTSEQGGEAPAGG